MQKGKRKETWSSMRYGSMKIPEGFRKQSSNFNRDNGLIGIMPCRNLLQGMIFGICRHFGSAFSSDQGTVSCPLTQIWYSEERKRTSLVSFVKAGRAQSMIESCNIALSQVHYALRLNRVLQALAAILN